MCPWFLLNFFLDYGVYIINFCMDFPKIRSEFQFCFSIEKSFFLFKFFYKIESRNGPSPIINLINRGAIFPYSHLSFYLFLYLPFLFIIFLREMTLRALTTSAWELCSQGNNVLFCDQREDSGLIPSFWFDQDPSSLSPWMVRSIREVPLVHFGHFFFWSAVKKILHKKSELSPPTLASGTDPLWSLVDREVGFPWREPKRKAIPD